MPTVMVDGRETITAREASDYLGVPASSIRAWASKTRSGLEVAVGKVGARELADSPGAIAAWLKPAKVDRNGRTLYFLEDVIRLCHETKRRPGDASR